MLRKVIGLGCVAMLSAVVGCAMCADCQDDTSPVVSSGFESPVYKSTSDPSAMTGPVLAEPIKAPRPSGSGSK